MSTIQVKAYFLKQKKISKEAVTGATEIRRFNVEIEQNDSYNSLLNQIRTFFQNVLSTNNSIKTFYLDEENEFIGFSSDSELKYALNLSSHNSLFKIYITLDKDSKDNLASSSSDENENLKCNFKEHHWRKWKNMMDSSNQLKNSNDKRDKNHERKREKRQFFLKMCNNMIMEKQSEVDSLKDEKLEGEQSNDESKKQRYHGHHCKQWKILKHQIKNGDQSKNPNMNGDQSRDYIESHHYHNYHKKCLMRKNMMENSSELKDDICENELKEIQFKKLNNLVEFEDIEKQTKPKNELEQDIIINLPTISTVSTEPTEKEENNSKVHNPLNLHETKPATSSSSSSDLFPKLSVEPNLVNKNEKIDDVSKTVQCLKEMGFDDNCNWLTALVQSKKGNINEVLDALSPISFK